MMKLKWRKTRKAEEKEKKVKTNTQKEQFVIDLIVYNSKYIC